MDAGKTHKTPRSEEKNFISHNNNSSQNSAFTAVP